MKIPLRCTAGFLFSICLTVGVPLLSWGETGKFTAGLWEITATDAIIGIPSDIPPTEFSECLTLAEPVPHPQWPGESYEVVSHEFNGDILTWELKCQTPFGEKTKQGEIHFDGDHFSGSIAPGRAMPGERVISVTHLVGQLRGDCISGASATTTQFDESSEEAPEDQEGDQDESYEEPSQAEAPPYRWEGRVKITQKSEGFGTFTGVYDTSWILNVSWKERRRINVRDEQGRLVGQFVELVDDGSYWQGSETGSYALTNRNGTLYEGTLTGEGKGVGPTIAYGWIYYSMIDDDPLAAIYPSGAYSFGFYSYPGMPSFSTHGVYRTTDRRGHVDVSNIDHPNAAMLQYSVGNMLLNPNTSGELQLSALLSYKPPSWNKIGGDTEMRIIANDAMSGRYDNEIKMRNAEGNSSVHMIADWNVKRKLDVQVELEKVDREWWPKGGKDANQVVVRAKIKTEGITGKFVFTLDEVSQEDGYCLNAGDDSGYDLEFMAQSGFEAPEDEGMSIKTLDALSEASATIQSNDYGAWGKLRVKVISDDKEYQATTEDSYDYICIPLDDDEDRVADSWEDHYDVSDQDEEADEDLEPTEQNSHGDGIGLYEEYRGFEDENYTHKRLNPNRKEIFVRDEDGLVAQADFAGKTGLRVFYIGDDGWTGPDTNSGGGSVDSAMRVVNFNTSGFGHVVDQHALHVVMEEYGALYPETIEARDQENEFDDLVIYGAVNCSRVASPGTSGKVIVYVDEMMKDIWKSIEIEKELQDMTRGEIEDVVTKSIIATTLHEMGHGVGIHHHEPHVRSGSKECYMCYYLVEEILLTPDIFWPSYYCKDPDAHEGKSCWNQIQVSDKLD